VSSVPLCFLGPVEAKGNRRLDERHHRRDHPSAQAAWPGIAGAGVSAPKPGIEELKTQSRGGSRQVVSGLDITPLTPSPQAEIIPSCWSGGRMLQASANRLY
jgi:hypothetical protein